MNTLISMSKKLLLSTIIVSGCIAITAQASATKKQTSQASAEHQIKGIYNYIQQLGQAQNTRLDCFAPSKNLTEAMKATGTSGLTDWIKLYGANNAQALYGSLKVLELKDAQKIHTGFKNLYQKIEELQKQEQIVSSVHQAPAKAEPAVSFQTSNNTNASNAITQNTAQKTSSQSHEQKQKKEAAASDTSSKYAIKEFVGLSALLQPLQKLEEEIISLGSTHNIPDWKQKVALFKERAAKIRNALAKIKFNTIEEEQIFFSNNQDYILTLLGVKPMVTYSNPVIHDYEKFKIIFDELQYDSYCDRGEKNDYPKKLENGQKSVLLNYLEPLIPFSKIYEWYPNIVLFNNKKNNRHGEGYRDGITQKTTLGILLAFSEYAYNLWKGKIEKKIDPFQGNPFDEDGVTTEDVAAIMMGYQPLAWKKFSVYNDADRACAQWNSFYENQQNYNYLLRYGNVDYADNSPFMQLQSKLTEYAIRSLSADDAYLLVLGTKLGNMIENTLTQSRGNTSKLQIIALANIIKFVQEMFKKEIHEIPQQPTLQDLATLLRNFLSSAKKAKSSQNAENERLRQQKLEQLNQQLALLKEQSVTEQNAHALNLMNIQLEHNKNTHNIDLLAVQKNHHLNLLQLKSDHFLKEYAQCNEHMVQQAEAILGVYKGSKTYNSSTVEKPAIKAKSSPKDVKKQHEKQKQSAPNTSSALYSTASTSSSSSASKYSAPSRSTSSSIQTPNKTTAKPVDKTAEKKEAIRSQINVALKALVALELHEIKNIISHCEPNQVLQNFKTLQQIFTQYYLDENMQKQIAKLFSFFEYSDSIEAQAFNISCSLYIGRTEFISSLMEFAKQLTIDELNEINKILNAILKLRNGCQKC